MAKHEGIWANNTEDQTKEEREGENWKRMNGTFIPRTCRHRAEGGRHRAEYTGQGRDNDVITGIREEFYFTDRNGKHREVEAFNPVTGITTRIHDAEQEQAA